VSECPSVRPSVTQVDQSKTVQDYQIFTIGCPEDSSFGNREAFP